MTRIRLASLTLCLGLALACSSTGTVGPTRTYEVPTGRAWAAAIDAVQLLDADIQVMDRSSGVIVARMPFEVIGGAVTLNITVRGTGAGGDLASGVDVQVSAREAGQTTTDPEHLEALRELEERYLELVTAALRGRGGY